MSDDRSRRRLQAVEIDEESLAPVSRDVEHERQVAIFDLLEENHFDPAGMGDGPYTLKMALVDGRLALDISNTEDERRHLLSLTPFKAVIRDYFMICESYYEAIRNATPSQIEAIDMGRRGIHNEGSERLRERLAGKVEFDHDTARRLFTLICALYRHS
jgi:uncharacterized protein (UPF0262 family)